MASAEIILARLEDGEDPDLLKIVDNRVSETGRSRLEVLRELLREG
jgi:regulator of RNase E activity RraB